MAEELPDQFDLIVIGTGFTETLIAAAASRVGKSVLHVDSNEYYGHVWSSLSLDAFFSRLDRPTDSNSTLRNATYKWNFPEAEPMEVQGEAPKWSRESLLEKSRRFSLDLTPRIVYSAGDMVQLLIKSNICRYMEFRAVDNVCMLQNGEIVPVPCTRSDVFNTKNLTMVEKRLLMKFLTACNDYGEDKCNEDSLAFRGRTFYEYLQAQRVTEKISSCVMQAIAMCGPETSFEEGMQRTQQFLGSLGRYGNTPFLYPMYGTGELPQCFSRLCAVYGGIYCLKRIVEDISLDASTNEMLLSTCGKTLRATKVVAAQGFTLHSKCEMRPHISRGIFMSTKPLGNEELNKGGGGVNFLRLVNADATREAAFMQLSHHTAACPEGLFIFHMTTPAVSDDPAADLRDFRSQLFDDSAREILLSCYFTIATQTSRSTDDEHILYTDVPNFQLDYSAQITNARQIFEKLYGDEEFLPRAPDAEEIVVEGEDPSALNENRLPEDLRAQLRDMKMAAQRMDIQE
ncbi:hypothetical protein KR018_007627 [Drosophila ironensis]|nr:hypothetical protein KR018_007627 [Drosophila ironensis]